MKLNNLVILTCFILYFTAAVLSTKNLNKKSSFSNKGNINFILDPDVLGATAAHSKLKKSAITYGLADVSAYAVPENELSKLKTPTLMTKLPDKFDLPSAGPLENVEEIDSNTDYYDGSMNLNKKKISCKIHGNATECLKHSSCGWCGSKNSCILGNNLGPLQSCMRSTFLYSSPVPNFTPTSSVQADETGIKFNIQ